MDNNNLTGEAINFTLLFLYSVPSILVSDPSTLNVNSDQMLLGNPLNPMEVSSYQSSYDKLLPSSSDSRSRNWTSFSSMTMDIPMASEPQQQPPLQSNNQLPLNEANYERSNKSSKDDFLSIPVDEASGRCNYSGPFWNQSCRGSESDETDLPSDWSGESKRATHYRWPFLALAVLVIVGVLGNVLVCMAICLERRLQNGTNYFLLSLAIADLLVSLLVMPISIVNEVYGSWPFGTVTCNLWVTCDVLCCSSSIYHMCVISVGRYIGIKNPLHARQAHLLVSRRAVLLKIVLVWLISALITSPITILGLVDQSNVQPERQVCSISNKYFIIIGAFGAFYLPMIIMVNSYILTVRLLREKAKFCKEYEWTTNTTNIGGNGRIDVDPMDFQVHNKFSECENMSRENVSTESKHSKYSAMERGFEKMHKQSNDFEPDANDCGSTRNTTSSFMIRTNFGDDFKATKRKQRNTNRPVMFRTLGCSLQVRTEQKATQVLGLVFILFIICWAPFFTRNIIEILFPSLYMPSYLPTIFQQLGFFSSTINPIIYTIFNRNFRRAFRRILLCKTSKYNIKRRNPLANLSHRHKSEAGMLQQEQLSEIRRSKKSPEGDGKASNEYQNRKLTIACGSTGAAKEPTEYANNSGDPGGQFSPKQANFNYRWKFRTNQEYHIDRRISGKSSQV